MFTHSFVTGQVELTVASGRKQVYALFFSYEGVGLAVTPAANASGRWQVTHAATGLRIPTIEADTPQTCMEAFLSAAPNLKSTSHQPLIEILQSADADPLRFIGDARARMAVRN